MGRLCFITTRRRRDLAEESSQTSRRTLKKGSRRRGPANLEDQKRPRRLEKGHSKRAAEKEVLQQFSGKQQTKPAMKIRKGELVAAFQGKVPPDSRRRTI